MPTNLTYEDFSALALQGPFASVHLPPGTRFDQPIAYQQAEAASGVRDAEWTRKVMERGRAGLLNEPVEMVERECVRCGGNCSPWQCGARS